MKYFDLVPVGQLVTVRFRYWIDSRIFGQEVHDYQDPNEDVCGANFYVLHELEIDMD
jgi:hypothetical protein